jgi:hypothetical protein
MYSKYISLLIEELELERESVSLVLLVFACFACFACFISFHQFLTAFEFPSGAPHFFQASLLRYEILLLFSKINLIFTKSLLNFCGGSFQNNPYSMIACRNSALSSDVSQAIQSS